MKKSIKNKLNEIFSDEKILKKFKLIDIAFIIIACVLIFTTNFDIYLQILFICAFIWSLIKLYFDKQKSKLYKIFDIIFLLCVIIPHFFSFSKTTKIIILLILFFSLYILHKEGKPS